MDLLDEIKRIDLQRYASDHYEVKSYPDGKAHCPIHKPDIKPSFNFWKGEDDKWFFKDHHDGKTGTIIDFEIAMGAGDESNAIKRIAKNESISTDNCLHYLYRSIEGDPLYWKVRGCDPSGGKKWWVEYENGKCEQVPYMLPDSKNHSRAIVCEGEKDADTVRKVVNGLNLDYWVTSAPNGMSSWPNIINQYFAEMKETTFLYDVGEDADHNVRKHASKLKKALPDMSILIAHVPLEKKDADITDYLSGQEDKKMALLDILEHAETFVNSSSQIQKEHKEAPIETLEQFMGREIPKIERLIDPYLERYGLTLIGGSKGVGKSLFATQMALHYASGQSGFLNSTVNAPGKVLLIQQEVHEAGMQDRLVKMLKEGNFNPDCGFYPKTTTGCQWHLTEKQDKEEIISLIEKTEPDVLILDPLYTFFPGELNQAKDMSKIISVLMEFKSNYNLSLVVVHHFSNKANPDDPKSTPGRFLGHSNLANAADVTIGIDFLHPRYREQILPLPYNHYACIDTVTRHGEWPEKLYVERGENRLLFQVSSIWKDIGRKIIPEEILDYLKENGGEMFQQDVITKFKDKAHENTIRKAIREAEKMGKLDRDTMPGKYGKKILRLKQQNQGG